MDELQGLREELASSAEPLTAARIAEAVRSSGLALGSGTTQQLVRSLRDELVGLGPLQQFVDQEGVTDVMVGAEGKIYTDGVLGLRATGISVGSEEQARGLARRLIAMSGGRLDEGHPLCRRQDRCLPDPRGDPSCCGRGHHDLGARLPGLHGGPRWAGSAVG